MKSISVKLFAIVAVAVAFSTQVNAQEPSGTSGLVTVLDVAKVFEKNPSFKDMMEQIKSEADQLKQKIQGDQEALRQAAMELQNYEPGSPERNQREADLAVSYTHLTLPTNREV